MITYNIVMFGLLIHLVFLAKSVDNFFNFGFLNLDTVDPDRSI